MPRMRKTGLGLAQKAAGDIGRPLTLEEEYLLEIADKYCNAEPHPGELGESDPAA